MRLATFDIEDIAQSGAVYTKKCNGIIFINSGDVDATISDIPLLVGQTIDAFSKSFPEDVLKNTFDLKFKQGTIGTNPSVKVVRKFYTPIAPNEECKYKRS